MHPSVAKFLEMSQAELDEIYKGAIAGVVPDGNTRGTAIVGGSLLAKLYARVANLFFWQGKVFDIFCPPDQGILINKVTPFSLTFVIAKVYKQASWLDGAETIVIDYSTTSFFAKKVRDEIRQVEPGVYLGKVWWGKKRILDFALEVIAERP
ncbi:hypothetical protein Tel_08985 [Candidatus Tenderia electrophaga]|uniref:Uncharacterized protein n=1 Tax=Candidatus Tenderia electrophaga TaxID=1748243 RepID=A0A0S2TDP7_9GAMM|nr:hypothetical protein Tel_08985 [Candidatus Tenderia electrophaga]